MNQHIEALNQLVAAAKEAEQVLWNSGSRPALACLPHLQQTIHRAEDVVLGLVPGPQITMRSVEEVRAENARLREEVKVLRLNLGREPNEQRKLLMLERIAEYEHKADALTWVLRDMQQLTYP